MWLKTYCPTNRVQLTWISMLKVNKQDNLLCERSSSSNKTPTRSPDSPVWRVRLYPQFTAVQTSRIRVTKCKHITQGRGVSFWLGGGSAAHQRIVFYLNLGCSGLAGRPPMHCPVLHSPSPSLHAARWTDGPTDRWMDGWWRHERISKGREALQVREQSNCVL